MRTGNLRWWWRSAYSLLYAQSTSEVYSSKANTCAAIRSGGYGRRGQHGGHRVFTSLGFQLLEIESTGAILWLWVLGGLCALCGALCYAELGAHTASGGEYHSD